MANGSRLDSIRQFVMPLLAAIALGAILYFGGQSNQLIGLAALDRLWVVLAHGLGIAEITVIALLVHRFIRYVVIDGLLARALGGPVPRLLIQISGLIVTVIAGAAIFGIVFQQDMTVLWAASGVFGFVFGMALKDMILDVFTGIALNLDRPIRIGDIVQLHRTGDQVVEGKVLEISWRATRLIDDYGNVVIVPNSRLGAATITNYSLPEPSCWVIVPVTLDTDVPPNRAIRILEAAVIEGAKPFMPPEASAPFVVAKGMTPTGVEYSVGLCVMANKRGGARSAVVQHIWKHLDLAGLKPSWPKLARVDVAAPGAPHETTPVAKVAVMLSATALFQDLPQSALARLTETAVYRTFPAGTILTQAGEAASAFFLILEGLASVEPRKGRRQSGSGSGLQGPGGMIGAQALLMGDVYAATVRCRTDVQVAEMELPVMGRLLAGDPGLALPLSRRLAEDIRAGSQPTGDDQRSLAAAADLVEDVLASIRRTFPGVAIP